MRYIIEVQAEKLRVIAKFYKNLKRWKCSLQLTYVSRFGEIWEVSCSEIFACGEKRLTTLNYIERINVTKKKVFVFLDPYVSANINSLSYSSETLDDGVGTISKVQATSHVEEHQDNLGFIKITRQHS
jgi:hypothetical protein